MNKSTELDRIAHNRNVQTLSGIITKLYLTTEDDIEDIWYKSPEQRKQYFDSLADIGFDIMCAADRVLVESNKKGKEKDQC